MNGRMYDPVVGRMLSTDNNIIGAYSTLGYDRYSYALNNPLKYTDPDGENPLLIAAAIGAITGLIGNGISNAQNGQDFFKGAGKAVVWGAISGMAFHSVGAVFGKLGNFSVEAGRAMGHAFVGTYLTAIQAAVSGTDLNFAGSYASGLVASGLGSGAQALNLGVAGTYAAGGVGGAFGEKIMGGDPIKGFTRGLILAGVNHGMHVLMQPRRMDVSKATSQEFVERFAEVLRENDGPINLMKYFKNFPAPDLWMGGEVMSIRNVVINGVTIRDLTMLTDSRSLGQYGKEINDNKQFENGGKYFTRYSFPRYNTRWQGWSLTFPSGNERLIGEAFGLY